MKFRAKGWSIILLLLVSIAGFIDASYLTIKHYTEGIIGCVIFAGCEIVTGSEYATIFNIPVALLGALYYALVSTLLFLYIGGEKRVLKPLVGITTGGFLFTLYLIYLQAFVLNAWCFYCLISAAISTVLFVGSVYLLRNANYVTKRGGVDKPSD